MWMCTIIDSEPAHCVRGFQLSPSTRQVTSPAQVAAAPRPKANSVHGGAAAQTHKRHQDISTKNKSVTLLTNILQRLTEQHFVLQQNPTKLQKVFVDWDDSSQVFVFKTPRSAKQETLWM